MCTNIRSQRNRILSNPVSHTNKTHKCYSLEEDGLIEKISNPAPVQVLRVYSKSKPIRFKQKITNAPTSKTTRQIRAITPINIPAAEAIFLFPRAVFILFKFSFNIFSF